MSELGMDPTLPDLEPVEQRGVVELQDALDAINHVGVVLAEALSGRLTEERIRWAGAMLAIARDQLDPLPVPVPWGTQDRENLTKDLQFVVDLLRRQHPPDTVPEDWT